MAVPFRFWFSPRRCFSMLIASVLFTLIYYFIRSLNSDEMAEKCRVDPVVQLNLLKLAEDTDSILSSENITHFLCYGTLWGALRKGDLLPWKREFDFCILNEDLSGHDIVDWKRSFRRRGMEIDYSNVGGLYSIWNSDKGRAKGLLNLYVFEKMAEEREMRRIGLNRLMALAADTADAFPMNLAMPPLNRLRIRDWTFPAPREGAEIQKYHYKDNWWQELKPDRC